VLLEALVLVAALVVGLAACGTYTTYQTAEPLARGRWQVSAALTPGLFNDTPSRTKTPTVITELALRRGLGSDTDVGLKLFTIGSEVSVRHRIVDQTWQWALLGALVYARADEQAGLTRSLLGQVRIGAVATRRTSPRIAFSLGPLVTGSAYTFGGGGNAQGLLVGGFANLQWTFGSMRRWHLIPELSIHGAVAGDVPVEGFVTMLGFAVARDF
jgi:hypothetical protein